MQLSLAVCLRGRKTCGKQGHAVYMYGEECVRSGCHETPCLVVIHSGHRTRNWIYVVQRVGVKDIKTIHDPTASHG